jgi:transcriptional regulator with XRE-family HTH domain
MREGNPVKFRKWIVANGGEAAVARLLGVTRQSVWNWLNGISTPRAKTIREIVDRADGEVGYADVILETLKSKADRR